MCGISIRIPDVVQEIKDGKASTTPEWVTKWDGAENTAVEAVKGGLSGAMKRAAVQWGIGRYLYKLDTNFVHLVDQKPADMKGWSHHYDKGTKKRWYWNIPDLPTWALPEVKND